MFVGLGMSLVSKLRSGVAAFSPAALFSAGEEGAWYEPSTTTAFTATYSGGGFTDIAPAGYGNLCAILLDKSQGAGYSGGSFTGLGSELVTNGGFETGDLTGWTEYFPANGDVTVSGGEATISKTGTATHGLYQDLSTTAGTWQLLRFDVTALTATAGFAIYGSGFTILEFNGTNLLTAAKTYEYLFYASTATPRVYFVAGNSSSLTIDNISVRELPGNHATQGTESARPILARVPETGRRNLAASSYGGSSRYNYLVETSTMNVNSSVGLTGDNTLTEFTVIDETSRPQALYLNYTFVSGTQYTVSAVFKSPNYRYVGLTLGANYNYVYAVLDTVNLDVERSGVLGAGNIFTSAYITNEGNGLFRVSLTGTLNAGNASRMALSAVPDSLPAINVEGLFYHSATIGDVWAGGDWQVEETSSVSSYQKVVDQYDITEAGVTSLEYLAFDGSDDNLIAGPYTFAGAGDGIWVASEPNFDVTSATPLFSTVLTRHDGSNTSNNIYNVRYAYKRSAFGSSSGETRLGWGGAAGNGDMLSDALSANETSVVYWAQTSGGTTRYNGADYAVGVTPDSDAAVNGVLILGDDGYGNNLDGKLFSLIVRGASSTAQEISDTESYVANLSGVTL